MHSTSFPAPSAPTHELRFTSLFDAAHGYVFPCDAGGHVDMDALNRMALQDYLFARAVVGRELFLPQVKTCSIQRHLSTVF